MEWRRVPIHQIADVNPKDGDWSLADDEFVSFIPMRAVSDETASISEVDPRLFAEVRRGYTPFRENDILFAKITPCMENGKIAIAHSLTNGVGFGSTEFHVLRAGSTILPEYLYYFMRRESFRSAAKQHMRGGAGQQRVPEDFLRNEHVPLPPLSDQRRIVEILDQADHLRHLRTEADAKANRILPALFIKMFGDPATNSMGWDTKPFRELLTEPLRNGLSPSSAGSFRATVLTLSAITGGTFDETATKDRYFAGRPSMTKEVDPRDFLICRGNGNLGLVGRARFPPRKLGNTLFPDTIIAARVNSAQVNGAYLEALWHTNWMRLQIESRATTTSGIHKINQATLGSLPVRLPPLPLQIRFGSRSSRLWRSSEAHRTDALDRLFGSLSHRAFLGELTN